MLKTKPPALEQAAPAACNASAGAGAAKAAPAAQIPAGEAAGPVPVLSQARAPAAPRGGSSANLAKQPVRPRRKKTPCANGPARENLRTAADRLKVLPVLRSLKTPLWVEPEAQDVAVQAPPPPAPPPAAEPVAGAALDRGAPIPAQYGLDRLVALARDANWLFVYWELDGALARWRPQYPAEALENARWALRVRNLRDMNHTVVEVALKTGQWYVKAAAGERFILEIGFFTAKGEFNCVLQGNEVATPRAAVSGIVDERWGILRKELESLLRASGAGPDCLPAPVHGSAGFVRSEQPRAIGLFSSYLARRAPPPPA